MKIYVASLYMGRFGEWWEAIPQEDVIKKPSHMGRVPQSSKFETRDKLKAHVKSRGDYLLEDHEVLRQAIKDQNGRLGFPQKKYSSRTSFVGPEDECYDLLISDRSNGPLEEGAIYRIGETIRKIKREGQRSLKFVKVTKLGC